MHFSLGGLHLAVEAVVRQPRIEAEAAELEAEAEVVSLVSYFSATHWTRPC